MNTPQTPGSPTPGFISDWPAGVYSGDAAGRPDRPTGPKATYPQDAKELLDQVTKSLWPQRIGADYLAPATHAPEAYLEEIEGRLVANAAQQVHKMGGQFDGWPKITRTYLRTAGLTEITATYFRGFVITDEDGAEHVQIRLEGMAIAR